jgi:multidrug efflux pump subunit AcrA (membrane-fusion protein)
MSKVDSPDLTHQEPDLAVAQLDMLLDELEVLAKSNVSRQEFYQGMLDRAVLGMGASAGCVFIPGPDQQWVPVFGAQLDQIYPNLMHTRFKRDVRLLDVHLEETKARILNENLPNSEWLMVSCGVEVDAANRLALVLYLPKQMRGAASRNLLPIVDALGELVQEFEHHLQSKSTQSHSLVVEKLHRFGLAIHSYRSIRQVAFDIANDGIALTGCQRITVLRQNSWGAQLLATSGLADVDNRSNVVRSMRRLSAAVGRLRTPLIWMKDSGEVSRKIRASLEFYQRFSEPEFLAVIPVFSKVSLDQNRWSESGHVVGAIITERFEPTDKAEMIRKLRPFSDLACSGLRQAARYESIPLRPVWVILNSIFRWFALDRIPKTAIALALLAGLLLAAFSIKTDFQIEIRGELRPVKENNLFAPVDGIVEQLFVKHGDQINAGEEVLRLRSPELEKELARIQGEIRTARRKYESIETALTQIGGGSAQDFVLQTNLAADLEEQKQVIANFQSEQRFFEKRLEELVVHSNATGQVVTWNLEQTLKSRPVRRGESLMRIADVDGQWHLVFEVPDQKFGYLQRAGEASNQKLDIEFVLATNPEEEYSGQIVATANTSQLNQYNETVVRMYGQFDRSSIAQLRPGAVVTARAYCGQKSIAYVWTYELVDSVKRRFFW